MKRICCVGIIFLGLFLVFAFSLSAQGNGFGAEVSSGSGDLLSMDFKNADIRNVLRLLAKQNGLNLVASKDVNGEVTVHFSEVTLEEALETILKANGYDFSIQKNIIFVKPFENGLQAKSVTKIYDFDYLDANDVRETIKAVLSKDGRAEVLVRSKNGSNEEKRSDILVVTDDAERILEIDKVVAALDIALKQVNIQIKMYETTLNDDSQVGIRWPTNLGASVGDARSNPTDPPSKFSLLAPINKVFDKGNRQISWGKLSVDEVKVAVSFLDSDANSKLVSNPYVITTDNQQASIAVGTIVPIQTVNRGAAGDIITFTDKEVNISLVVTPHLNNDSTITMYLTPKIEDIIGYVGSGDNRQPIISKRSIKTQVKVKNGETVVIGGLIKENEVETVERVWLLGRIPILGRLFTHTVIEKEKTDFILFITPNVVDEENRP